MIGGGVFVLSGRALEIAGPSAIFSFIIAGFVVALSALSLAIITKNETLGESGYEPVGSILSPLAAFIVTWSFYLNAVIASAFVLDAFGTYMHDFVTKHMSGPLWAIIALIVLTLVNFASTRWVGRAESSLVFLKLAVLILLVISGLMHLQTHSFVPFFSHGLGAAWSASAILFIAFLGFNVITNIASEIDKPEKTIPRAIILSMAVVLVVYIGVSIAMLTSGLHHFSEASVGQAASRLMGPVGQLLIVIGALVATLSAANANLLSSSEIMMRLSVKKYVPTILGKPFRGHPFVSVLLAVIAIAGLLATNSAMTAISLANITAIIGLLIIDAAAFRLLAKQKGRIPLIIVVPIFAFIGALWQFAYTPVSDLAIGIGIVCLGAGLYAIRERFHNKRHHRDITDVLSRQETPVVNALKQ